MSDENDWLSDLPGIREIFRDGVAFIRRKALDFKGTGWTVVDNPATGRTDVEINLAEVVSAVAEEVLIVPVREIAGTSHTLELTDRSKELRPTNGSETTITVPPHADVPWPLASRVAFLVVGAGKLIVAPGDGVTIHVASGFDRRVRAQYLPAILANIAEDEWVLYGALEATE